MKTTFLKLSLLSLLFLGLVNGASAQASISFGPGFLFGISDETEDFSAFGIYVRPRVELNDQISLGLNTGAYFDTDESSQVDVTQTIIPLVFTGEYKFGSTDGLQPYAGAGLGAWIVSTDVDFKNNNDGNDFDDSDALFAFSLYGGLRYPLTGSLDLDFNLGFDIVGDNNDSNNNDDANIFLPLNLGLRYRFN